LYALICSRSVEMIWNFRLELPAFRTKTFMGAFPEKLELNNI